MILFTNNAIHMFVSHVQRSEALQDGSGQLLIFRARIRQSSPRDREVVSDHGEVLQLTPPLKLTNTRCLFSYTELFV